MGEPQAPGASRKYIVARDPARSRTDIEARLSNDVVAGRGGTAPSTARGPGHAIRVRAVALGLALLVVLIGCGDGEEGRRGPGARGPGGGGLDFGRIETVAAGLDVPWGLGFPDERTILVTERPGRVRLIRGGRLQPEPVAELEVVAEGEAGLLGIALHPDFPKQRSAYLYYTASDGNRVSRFRLTDDFRFREEQVLIQGIPAAPFHDGGRIDFGPDGMLYVATGETGDPQLAADRDSLAGKFLRIRPDGSVPDDNPFGDSPVFSYGHRNPQGFDWDDQGRLYASDHGPSGEFGLCCLDEINLVEAGKFYGWPVRAGRTTAAGGQPPEEPVEPVVTSGGETTWAPAGLAVHRPDGGATSLLVAELAGEELLRVVVTEGDPREVARTEVALDGFGRLRAARIGPDECLYVTTSNTDGRGDPREGDDRVLRACLQG